jgi:hypothetical protein
VFIQKQDSNQKSKISKAEIIPDASAVKQTQSNEKNIPDKYILEFISRHHLNRIWEEFIYEKNHPKIPLSARDVLELINLPPEEQERILKDHE